jgi:molybdenum cofactor guanylyltransferase
MRTRLHTTPAPTTHMFDGWGGVVLAGGRSRRMGRDKALLEWQGRTLLDHAIARFQDTGCARIIASGDRPEHGGLLDTYPDSGPLGGLHAAALACPGCRLVAVAVDMPRLPAQWLRLLAQHDDQIGAVHFDGSPLPVSVQATDRAISTLEARLRDPNASRALHDWLDVIGAVALPSPPNAAEALTNLNTPAEWKAMRT